MLPQKNYSTRLTASILETNTYHTTLHFPLSVLLLSLDPLYTSVALALAVTPSKLPLVLTYIALLQLPAGHESFPRLSTSTSSSQIWWH